MTVYTTCILHVHTTYTHRLCTLMCTIHYRYCKYVLYNIRSVIRFAVVVTVLNVTSTGYAYTVSYICTTLLHIQGT